MTAPIGRSWCAWIVDNRAEEKLRRPIATCPMPPVDVFSRRGGRFGAHNLWENLPKEGCYKSDQFVFGTFFNGGLRAFDLGNPYQPKEAAYFVPEVPGAPFGSCQLNDVFIDDRGIVFTVDPLCWRALLPRDGFLRLMAFSPSPRPSPPQAGRGRDTARWQACWRVRAGRCSR